MTPNLATQFAAAVGIVQPTIDQVKQYGVTPHGYTPTSPCAVHQGLATLVTQFVTEDGKPLQLPEHLPPVLSIQDADHALEVIAPDAHAKGQMPYLAALMFHFDRRTDRIVQVDGIWQWVYDVAKLQRLRPRKGEFKGPRPSIVAEGHNRIAQVGRASWHLNSNENRGTVLTQRFSTAAMDRIFRDRDKRLQDSDLVLVGSN